MRCYELTEVLGEELIADVVRGKGMTEVGNGEVVEE